MSIDKAKREAIVLDLLRECDRAVSQALRNTTSGERTYEGGTYETCFNHILEKHLQPAQTPAKKTYTLKACAHCGGTDIDLRTRKTTIVECINCGVLVIHADEQTAVHKWNNRTASVPEHCVLLSEFEYNRITEENATLLAFTNDEVWHWQDDEHDHPESLSCPVIMSAKQLRDLLVRKAPTVDEEVTVDSDLFKIHQKLGRIMVAGCTCMTKTPDIQYHKELCHYRLAQEISNLLMKSKT